MSLHAPLVLLALTFAFVRFLLIPNVDLIFGILLVILSYRFYRQQLRVTPSAPVLITGCDTGFGLITTQRLDAMGVRVFAACLTQDGVDRLKACCSDRVVPFVMDVTKDIDVETAAQRIAASGLGLWAVINNAGIASGIPIDLMPLSVLKKTIDVNFYGVMRTTKAVLPFLKRSKGRVINIASVAGRISMPSAMSYCSSKYAVEAFNDALRREVHVFGIRVVCIEPGYHSTPIMANLSSTIDAILDQVPADKKAEYGAKYFEDFRIGTLKLQTQGMSKPDGVRDALIDSLFQVEPPTHRFVGVDANYFFGPFSLLPGFMQDAIIMAGAWLTVSMPVPASAMP